MLAWLWLMLAVVASALGPLPDAVTAQSATVARFDGWRDWEILNGAFFTQGVTPPDGGGVPTGGFAIRDRDGVRFWQGYQALGGSDALGWPLSRVVTTAEFSYQVTDRAVLQWRPTDGRTVLTNAFDDLSAAGFDGWLQETRGIPPPAAIPEDVGQSPEEILRRRLPWLTNYPNLRAAYLATENPLETNGLPVAPVAITARAFVLRTQRTVFLQARVATPYLRLGQVTVVRAGEVVREAGLYPAEAFVPEPMEDHVVAPLRAVPIASDAVVDQWNEARVRAGASVVTLTDGTSGRGSGIAVDVEPTGTIILTNSHVVSAIDPARLVARLADGRVVAAEVVGRDEWTDVAVVRIAGVTDLPIVRRATVGQPGVSVLAVGYGSLFPAMPSAKLGTVRGLAGTIQTLNDYPLVGLIEHDALLSPGDSGGPLLTAQGAVVGMNSAIKITRVPRRGQELTSYAIPIVQAWAIALQLRSNGKIPRPYLGLTVVPMSQALAQETNLPSIRGLYVREVVPDGPADIGGIAPGMIITTFIQQPVASLSDLRRLIVGRKIGDRVAVTVVRRVGSRPPSDQNANPGANANSLETVVRTLVLTERID